MGILQSVFLFLRAFIIGRAAAAVEIVNIGLSGWFVATGLGVMVEQPDNSSQAHDLVRIRVARRRPSAWRQSQTPRVEFPSTVTQMPEMKPARAEARKTTAEAMSSALAMRPSG